MIFPIPTEVYNIYDKQDKTYYLNTQPRTRLFYLVLGAFEEVVLSARGGGGGGGGGGSPPPPRLANSQLADDSQVATRSITKLSQGSAVGMKGAG